MSLNSRNFYIFSVRRWPSTLPRLFSISRRAFFSAQFFLIKKIIFKREESRAEKKVKTGKFIHESSSSIILLSWAWNILLHLCLFHALKQRKLNVNKRGWKVLSITHFFLQLLLLCQRKCETYIASRIRLESLTAAAYRWFCDVNFQCHMVCWLGLMEISVNLLVIFFLDK